MNNKKVKTIDLLIILSIVGIIMAFALSETLFENYQAFNQQHGLITSFLKFGILATFGEILGLRIRTKSYAFKGFGLIPKFVVWGFIGITIKFAFIVFATGTPNFLTYIGIDGIKEAMAQSTSFLKVITALCISTAMNIIYAPVMMTFHKLTDIHIAAHKGHLDSLIKPMRMGTLLKKVDWNIQWNFVFKKTIPLFWIPAHTITFLLPADYQVLFAAILSVALGLILATASLKSKKATTNYSG